MLKYLYPAFIFQENVWAPKSLSLDLCSMVCDGLALPVSSERVLVVSYSILKDYFVVQKEFVFLIFLYVKSELITWLHQCTLTLLDSSTLNGKTLIYLMRIATSDSS